MSVLDGDDGAEVVGGVGLFEGKSPAAQKDGAPTPTQTNSAKDHASVFTVMNGEQHIHHHYEDDGNSPPR
ncbi:hypothetical protein [Streptomyces sp. A5-4]|uniref:hypothetical protein n=1 Tax=Streptomyces sp. A5-4 TaxID=3384771 RepID=UPI003DAA1768